jgi:hypothetical protein
MSVIEEPHRGDLGSLRLSSHEEKKMTFDIHLEFHLHHSVVYAKNFAGELKNEWDVMCIP